MRVTILGCGSSAGVPVIGVGWGRCNPENPKNIRLRASIAVQEGETTLIVDTTPDFRTQCLTANIQHIDGVLYTHAHADHTHGIDDLRPVAYHQEAPIPIYADQATLDFLYERFGYAFPQKEEVLDIYRAFLHPHLIQGPFQVGRIPVDSFLQDHGHSLSLGYRFGKIAYSTDVVELDEAAFKTLEGVEVWVVDCIDDSVRPTHAHLEKTLKWIERVRPKRAYLTHMALTLDYDALCAQLPPGVEPAYDGLVIEV